MSAPSEINPRAGEALLDLAVPQGTPEGRFPGPAFQARKVKPYCDGNGGIWPGGFDRRVPRPSDADVRSVPWGQVGAVSRGGTATLIGSRYALTAAHVVVDGSGNRRYSSLTVKLGSSAGACAQEGVVQRAWYPSAYQQSADSSGRSYDIAVMEFTKDLGMLQELGPMAFAAVPWEELRDRNSLSLGYPANETLPYTTGPRNRFLGLYADPGGGGLWFVSNDATGGQSGSPIYIFRNGVRTVVGVISGIPPELCESLGYLWVCAITEATYEGINNIVNGAEVLPGWKLVSFDAAPGGGGVAGPCPR